MLSQSAYFYLNYTFLSFVTRECHIQNNPDLRRCPILLHFHLYAPIIQPNRRSVNNRSSVTVCPGYVT